VTGFYYETPWGALGRNRHEARSEERPLPMPEAFSLRIIEKKRNQLITAINGRIKLQMNTS